MATYDTTVTAVLNGSNLPSDVENLLRDNLGSGTVRVTTTDVPTGNPTIPGGAGLDLLNVGSGGGNVVLTGTDGNFIIQGTGNATVTGGAGFDGFVVGGSGNDNFNFGGAGSTTVYGGAGNDSILTGGAGDSVFAGDGNDSVFTGGGGDTVFFQGLDPGAMVAGQVGATQGSVIDTGSQVDVVVFENMSASAFHYNKVGNNGISASVNGQNVNIYNAEVLKFNDGALVFTNSDDAAALIRLYEGILNRLPDAEGAKYWLEQIGKADIFSLFDYFIKSNEAQGVINSMNNEQFLTYLYQNSFNRIPDQSGHDYWMDKLNHGISKTEVIFYFMNSQEAEIVITGVQQLDGLV